MGSELAIVLLVATTDHGHPTDEAMVTALRQSARRPIVVSTVETDARPLESAVAETATRSKADVIVDVDWQGTNGDEARIHIHGRDGSLVRTSALAFPSSAPATERGRAAGFAVATMLAEHGVAATLLAAPAAEVKLVPPTSTPEPPPPAKASDMRDGSVRPPPPPQHIARMPPRFGAEVAGLATADTGAGATGMGPSLRVQYKPWSSLALRFGGGPRWLFVGNRSAFEFGTSAGAMWTFATGPGFALGARAELLLLYDAYTEVAIPSRPTVDRTKLVPGGAVGIDTTLMPLGDMATVFVAVMVEVAGRAVTPATATQTSSWWTTGEAGLRVAF